MIPIRWTACLTIGSDVRFFSLTARNASHAIQKVRDYVKEDYEDLNDVVVLVDIEDRIEHIDGSLGE